MSLVINELEIIISSLTLTHPLIPLINYCYHHPCLPLHVSLLIHYRCFIVYHLFALLFHPVSLLCLPFIRTCVIHITLSCLFVSINYCYLLLYSLHLHSFIHHYPCCHIVPLYHCHGHIHYPCLATFNRYILLLHYCRCSAHPIHHSTLTVLFIIPSILSLVHSILHYSIII